MKVIKVLFASSAVAMAGVGAANAQQIPDNSLNPTSIAQASANGGQGGQANATGVGVNGDINVNPTSIAQSAANGGHANATGGNAYSEGGQGGTGGNVQIDAAANAGALVGSVSGCMATRGVQVGLVAATAGVQGSTYNIDCATVQFSMAAMQSEDPVARAVGLRSMMSVSDHVYDAAYDIRASRDAAREQGNSCCTDMLDIVTGGPSPRPN